MDSEEYFKKYINVDARAGMNPQEGEYRSCEKGSFILRLIDNLPDPVDVLDEVAKYVALALVVGAFIMLIIATINDY